MAEKFIDVNKILDEKNANLRKWIPGFVLRYVKRILHEDQVNAIMHKNNHLHGLEYVKATMKEFDARLEIRGAENVPKTGGVILAANHPMGGLDGIAFMEAVGRIRPDLQFLVNDILLNIKNFAPLFIPVNKHGANPRQATMAIEKAYASESAVMVFPAGLVSRKINGVIQDLEWKKSFIAKSKKYQKDIIPVYIDGRNSGFFYNLARFRSKVGIKANLEMFYLVNEFFKQKGKTITITFGKPIPHSTFNKTKTVDQWAEDVRKKVYDLA